MTLNEASKVLNNNSFKLIKESKKKMTVYELVNIFMTSAPDDYTVEICSKSSDEIYKVLDSTYDDTYDKTVFLCPDKIIVVHDSKNMDTNEILLD